MTYTTSPLTAKPGKTAATLLHKLAAALRRLLCATAKLGYFRLYF